MLSIATRAGVHYDFITALFLSSPGIRCTYRPQSSCHRSALGSKPDGPPYIETLRRRGYKFRSDDVVVEIAPSKVIQESALPSIQPIPRHAVERRGNVVALVDWKEAGDAHFVPDSGRFAAVEVVPRAEPRNTSTTRFLAGIAAVLIVAALGVGFLLNQPRAAEAIDESRAIEIVVLTNGEDVNDATISRDGKYFAYHQTDGCRLRMERSCILFRPSRYHCSTSEPAGDPMKSRLSI